MQKTIKVEVLTEWKDVTLRKYLDMTKDMEAYNDDEKAMTALMLHHLAGIPYESINHIATDSYNKLKEKLSKFMKPEGLPLQQFVMIDGVEYGIEPNLSKMAYGAYADISKYDTVSVDKNWGKIMSILYRPVIKKEKLGLYQIKPYDGEIDDTIWLDVSMDVHFGCLFFFINLQMDLMKDILKSLTGKELPPNINSILERSGEVMQRYLTSQKVI